MQILPLPIGGCRTWAPTVLRVALPVLLGAPPGAGMILPEQKSPEENIRARAGSNRFASQLGHSVMIEKTDGTNGSGVFLGYDEAGESGYVLTVAHLFKKALHGDGAAGKAQAATLRFCAPGSMGNREGDARILARRAFLHPAFQHRADPDRPGSRAKSSGTDLAVITFAVNAWTRRELATRGFFGATLYDGPATDHRSLLEAHVAGFGRSSTSAGARIEGSGLLLGGSTYVTHCTCNGRTAFHAVSLAPDDLEGKRFDTSAKDGENTRQFILGSGTQVWIGGSDPIPVQSHGRQVHLCFGDSGGPLFLEHDGQFQVAGIATTGWLGEGVTEDQRAAKVQVSVWEPVRDKAPWILGIMAGDAGASRVLDLAPKPEAEAAGGAAGSREESKAPAVDHGQGGKRKAAEPPVEEQGLSAGTGSGADEPPAKRRKLDTGAVAAPMPRAPLDLPGPQTIRNASGTPWRIFFPKLSWAVRVERLEEGKDPALLAELAPGRGRWADLPGRSRVRLVNAVDVTGKSLTFVLGKCELFMGDRDGAGPFRWVFQAGGRRDLDWFLGSVKGWRLGGGVVYQGNELEIQGMFHDEGFGRNHSW